jgi:hypothetical protein
MVLHIHANPADHPGYPFIRQRPWPRRIHFVLWCAALCLQPLGTDDLKHQSQPGAHHSHEERVSLPVYIHSPLRPQGAHSQLAGQDDVNPGKRLSRRHPWPNTAVLFQYRKMLQCKGRGSGLRTLLDLTPHSLLPEVISLFPWSRSQSRSVLGGQIIPESPSKWAPILPDPYLCRPSA